nr:hypothetical protein [[Mycoplasma] imitans]
MIDQRQAQLTPYDDYAKIKDSLSKVYDEATTASQSTQATIDTLNTAIAKLQTAISSANDEKAKFDSQNAQLVEAYKALKDTLATKYASLEKVKDDKYAAINANLNKLYKTADDLLTKTLDPTDGEQL